VFSFSFLYVEKAPVFAKKQTKGPSSKKKIDYAFLALIPVIILWVSLLYMRSDRHAVCFQAAPNHIVSGSSTLIT
jgi:hypothetical protein